MEKGVQELENNRPVAVNDLESFKLDPCIRAPQCGKCEKSSTVQEIDRAKIGTFGYSVYRCDDCKVKK